VTTAEELLTAGSIPKASQDAIVILGPLRPLGEVLAAAHRLLKDKGRLMIPLLCEGLTTREIVIALSEAGFVVLEPKPEAASSGPYLARRDGFSVRGYRDGDEEQILSLFRASFSVDRSLARWSWEYRDNPYGALRIAEAFTADGQLVAHYAGYPVRFHSEIGGRIRTLTALQIGDTMTEPSARRVGRGPTSVLGRTVRYFFARFCEGQVAFNYGFNTGTIQRFYLSLLGGRRLESAPFHVLDLEKRPLRPPSPLLSRLAGYRVERITRFDERWDELFRRVGGAYRFLVERDARYLEWRYARHPEIPYFLYAVFRRRKLVGWSAFAAKGEERLRWGDALFDPRHPEAVRQLLAHALAAPEHRQAKILETWATGRPAWWRELVVGLGFEARPEPDDLGIIFKPFNEDPEASLKTHLYYTMGDSDLF
jgi:hypothetical protein